MKQRSTINSRVQNFQISPRRLETLGIATSAFLKDIRLGKADPELSKEMLLQKLSITILFVDCRVGDCNIENSINKLVRNLAVTFQRGAVQQYRQLVKGRLQ